MQLSVKQFRVSSDTSSAVSQLSYCVYDPESRETILIDPHLDASRDYTDFLTENRLRLSLVVETQTHYSHPTAAHRLSKEFDAPIAMSEHTQSQLPDRKLASGEVIKLGTSGLTVQPIPGVQPDSLFLHGRGRPEMIFTGESIWFGASSALGLPGSSQDAFWASLSLMKSQIGPDSLVFSGYDVRGLVFSNWKTELKMNPDLNAITLDGPDGLRARKSRFPIRLSEDFIQFAQFNSKKSGPEIEFHKTETLFNLENLEPWSPIYSTISIDKLHRKKDAYILDVREPAEFVCGHIPGSRNIPLSSIPFHLDEISKAARVYCICKSGRRSLFAAASLSYVGFADAVTVTGGFQAWQNAGLPAEK